MRVSILKQLVTERLLSLLIFSWSSIVSAFAIDTTGYIDVTNAITENADFSNGESNWIGHPVVNHSCAEVWNKDAFRIYQTIVNIPNGDYVITCQGFYRYCNTSQNTNSVAANTHDSNEDKHLAYLFANGERTPLQCIALELSQIAANGINLSSSESGLPFDMYSAQQCFTAGLYADNAVHVKVTNGVLAFGVEKTERDGCDWTIFDNFKIYYKGNGNIFVPNPNNASGIHRGHTFVDLGLSAYWASYNVGASKPQDFGDFYAWGETSTKDVYSDYNLESNTSVDLGPSDDAATAHWGGDWHMPSKEQLDELLNKCRWIWMNYEGVQGAMVIGSNGNCIFLPAASFSHKESNVDENSIGIYGSYWSKTYINSSYATELIFGTQELYAYGKEGFYYHFGITGTRAAGRSVRPVMDKEPDRTGQDEETLVQSITITNEPTVMYCGESCQMYQLNATVLPTDASNPNISWASNNKDVATVSEDGVVTALSPGVVKIRAKATDGSGISATCQITVKISETDDGYAQKYAYRGFKNFSTFDPVNGLTADGMAQIFVTIPSGMDVSQGGAKPMLEFYDSKGSKLYLADNVNDRGQCYEIKYNEKFGCEGFIYRAPANFPIRPKQKHFVVKVYVPLADVEEGMAYLTSFDVYRPGLALIHGLNSSSDCFDNFVKYLEEDGSYLMTSVNNVSYKESNNKAFDYNANTAKVIETACEKLYTDLYEQGIVSYAYDLVGHSMGGILSRLYGQDETNKKHVHKIITVNTPHWGSPIGDLADLFPELQELDEKYSEEEGKTAKLWNNTLGTIIGPAISDLATSSQAIRDLSNSASMLEGVPVHAVCSYMYEVFDTPPVILPEKKSGFAAYLAAAGASLNNAIWFEVYSSDSKKVLDKIFGEWRHDGIVGFTSQLGGLPENATYVTIESAPYAVLNQPDLGLFGYFSDAHHCSTCSWSETKANLVSLLHAPVDHGKFCTSGFKEIDEDMIFWLVRDNVMPKAKTKAKANEGESGAIFKVSTNPDCNLHIYSDLVLEENNWKLSVMLDKSSDITKNILFSFYNDEDGYVGCHHDDYSIDVPSWYSGPLTLYALGVTDNNEVVSDTLCVEIPALTDIDYFTLEGVSSTMYANQKMSPIGKVYWENGERTYVNPEYTSSNPGIIKVEDGEICALSEGECTITASYRGHVASTKVNVVYKEEALGEEDGIEEVANSVSNVSPAVYSVSGIKLTLPQKGINIVRKKGGETVKVVR